MGRWGGGAQVGRRFGALFRVEHPAYPVLRSTPPRWHQWEPGSQEETRADEQASPPAWQGLEHLQSCHPSFSSSVHFCSFSSPFYILKAKMHSTTLAHHGPPSTELSPCSMLQVPTWPHHSTSPRKGLYLWPCPQRGLLPPIHASFLVCQGQVGLGGGGVSISSSLPNADVDSPSPSFLIFLPISE